LETRLAAFINPKYIAANFVNTIKRLTGDRAQTIFLDAVRVGTHWLTSVGCITTA
jgi:hypothetical protein